MRSTGLGQGFGRLWAANVFSGLGDGVTQIAGGLLAASLTRDPVLVSAVLAAETLPWIVFALPSGALADRFARRRLMIAASLLRVCGLGVLGLAVAFGWASLPLLYTVFFLVGCAGLVFDNSSMTSLPVLVRDSQLEQANGRLQATRSVTEQLCAKPLGGWLFAWAAWSPFLVDAGGLILIALLAASLPRALNQPAPGPHATLGVAVAEGVRWLRGDRLLRALTLTVGLSNIGLGAVFSIVVLVARERLGLGPVGYGVLIAAAAVGGLLGGLLAGRVVAAFGPGTALRAGLLVEIAAYPILALTHSALVAVLVLVAFGVHFSVFATIGASLRQALAPRPLLGRVHSVHRLVGASGMLLGAVVGGVLGKFFGLTAPFWFGLVCAVSFTLAVWRVLTNARIRAARQAAASAAVAALADDDAATLSA